MSGSLLDEGMNKVSDGKWVVNMLAKPHTEHNNAEGHVMIPEYLEGVRRPLDKGIKSVAVLFDAHIGIPSILSKPYVTNVSTVCHECITFWNL